MLSRSISLPGGVVHTWKLDTFAATPATAGLLVVMIALCGLG